MDDGDSVKHGDPIPNKIRAPRLAGIVLSEDSVKHSLRTVFFREIERATPEVLEKLRDNVWPQYAEAYHAALQNRMTPTGGFVQFQWPSKLQQAVAAWAKEVR